MLELKSKISEIINLDLEKFLIKQGYTFGEEIRDLSSQVS